MYHVGALDGNGKVRLGMKGIRALDADRTASLPGKRAAELDGDRTAQPVDEQREC